MAEAVSCIADGGVLTITLNRPKANAINVPTSLALYAAFSRLQDDPALRVGIITGTYSLAGRYVMVNARVMNYETGAVVSTAQVRLPMSAFVEGLAHGGKPQLAPVVRITGGAEAR